MTRVPAPAMRRTPAPSHHTSLAAALVLLILLPLLAFTGGPAGAVENTWTARAADLSGAAELASGGRGITVAVLDSWVDSRHPDFGGRVLGGATCSGGPCRPGGTDVPDSCEAHGTHVSGLVGSTRFGVAPEAHILPVRVLAEKDGACQAQAEDVASGVRYAASHGAQVINISLGSTYALTDSSRAIPRAVSQASAQGIVVVVAAGNGKTAGVDLYGDDALVVAATGPNGQLATYSQRGAGVDIAAPGGQPVGDGCTPDDCVVSTWSDQSYAADAGTSMAAPVVAGAAALLLAQRPDRGRDDVVSVLKRTAHPLSGAGAGRVDVLAAVRGSATGNGTDGVTGAAPSAGSHAGAASSNDPSIARVVRPDGSVGRRTTADRAKTPDTRGILLWTGVALVALVLVAFVVVARTQGLPADGRRYAGDGDVSGSDDIDEPDETAGEYEAAEADGEYEDDEHY
ncbi:MAG TPA: S8 family serine peptidase [Frankiaceae bacterium]|nr:S8 family serine peptidase [Frankiaceae bacterium]